jgi:hypothetical protein
MRTGIDLLCDDCRSADQLMRTLPVEVVAGLTDAATFATREALRARIKHRPFASRHEAFAILKEEVDELWDDIKSDSHANAHEEAVQVAAVALRLIAEFPPEAGK